MFFAKANILVWFLGVHQSGCSWPILHGRVSYLEKVLFRLSFYVIFLWEQLLINLLARDGWIGMSYSCLVRRGNELVDCDREREREWNTKAKEEREKCLTPWSLYMSHPYHHQKDSVEKEVMSLGSKCGFRPRNSHLSRGFLLVREEEEEEE